MRRPEGIRRGCGWIACLLCLLCLPGVQAARALDCPPLVERAAAAHPVRYADSLLWEVRRAGLPVSYLFGTIHLGDAAVASPGPAVTRALAEASAFALEVLFDPATLADVSDVMQLPGDARLRDLVGDELFTRTAALLRAYGVTSDLADRLKPWAAYTTLSLPPGQHALPLDLVLMGRAQAAGKRLFGLETLAEQTAVFDALPPAIQVALLRESVCHHARFQADTAALIGHYAAGDSAALYRLAHRYESPAQTRLMETLLVARNRRMVERLQISLAREAVFVAIGALHLPGADGVLAGLAAAGFELRPVPVR